MASLVRRTLDYFDAGPGGTELEGSQIEKER